MSELKFGVIDLRRAVEMVEKAVADKPEGYSFYDTEWYQETRHCANTTFVGYVDDDAQPNGEYSNVQPGCLIGTIVTDLIGDVNWFIDKKINGGTWGATSTRLVNDGLATWTDLAGKYLREAQIQQDGGEAWSKAAWDALSQILKVALTRAEYSADDMKDFEFLLEVFDFEPRPKEEFEAEKALRQALVEKTRIAYEDATVDNVDEAWKTWNAAHRSYNTLLGQY